LKGRHFEDLHHTEKIYRTALHTVTSLKADGEVYHTSEFGISTVNETLQYSDLG
jgi:hypothetical protein